MKKALLFFTLLFSLFANSQTVTLSPSAEISVITCGPGSELYTAFGHSAFRVRDVKQGFDRIYNYGTFDFNQPNFYGNFAKGNLLYFLGVTDTSRFLRTYYYEKRWVKGQVLDLSPTDVQKVYNFLENNALPENKEYLYDYFFDNCSTKLYDVIDETLQNKLIVPKKEIESPMTYRQLMQLYLGNQPWGDFGIDLCLGSVIDREVTANEYLFLPDNVFEFFNSLKISENGDIKPLVKRTEVILPEQKQVVKKSFFTPLFVFSLIAFIVIMLTWKNWKNKTKSRWLDFILFFATGIIGLLITSIWLGTNHISARNNFNVLWAFIPNLFVSFLFLKKKLPTWLKTYSLIVFLLLLLLILLWILKVQVFSIGILPIIIFLGIRYLYLYKIDY